MVKVKLLLFASFRDQAKTGRTELILPEGATVADLKKAACSHFPGIQELLPNALVSVNQEYAFDNDMVPDGAEVGLFPPVSGGSDPPKYPSKKRGFPPLPPSTGGFRGLPATILKVTYDVLDLDNLVEQITQETTGAVCVFSGIVRGITSRGNAHETSALEYEAYLPMAEAKMAQVAREIRERWPAVEGIVVVQRIGRLEPKTPTVIIACAAAHRDTGVFEAARYGIDRLKEIVPIWKKEMGPHGETWVEGDYHPHSG